MFISMGFLKHHFSEIGDTDTCDHTVAEFCMRQVNNGKKRAVLFCLLTHYYKCLVLNIGVFYYTSFATHSSFSL